jgi:P27 family predicted phage terminase small subunit
MRTGRPKKDSDLDALHGRPGKHKAKKRRQILAKDVKFGIPRGLPESVRIKARIAAKHLIENKISKDCDRAAFERYCQHLKLVYDAYKTLNKEGEYITDNRGVSRKHPSAQIHKDNSIMALKYEEQFGLTPLSRGKVKGGPVKKETELEKFQKEGKKIQAVR